MELGVDIVFQKDSKSTICLSVPKRRGYDFRMQRGTTCKTVTMKLIHKKKKKKRRRKRRRKKKVEKKTREKNKKQIMGLSYTRFSVISLFSV